MGTLFGWAFKKGERVSQTPAHRYLNGEGDIRKYVYEDGNEERDIKLIIKEIKQDLSKQSTNILLDDLRAKGIKIGPSKNLYQGPAAEVLAKQLNEIIKDADRTSRNFSKIPKNPQPKDNKKVSNKAVALSLIRHISKLFNLRLPNSNEYKYAFTIYIINSTSNSTISISINVSREEWQQTKSHI